MYLLQQFVINVYFGQNLFMEDVETKKLYLFIDSDSGNGVENLASCTIIVDTKKKKIYI